MTNDAHETPDHALDHAAGQPQPPLSAADARRALDRAADARIASEADSSVYALATAAFGVLLGAYFAATRIEVFDEHPGLGAAGYFLIAAAIGGWQARASRVVPRGARRISTVALVVTCVVIMVVLGVVNSVFREQPQPALALVGAGLVVAAPLLVAGGLIRRGAR